MNRQNYAEHGKTSDRVKRKGQDMNNPAAAGTDSFASKGSVLGELIQQTPMASGIVTVGPVDERIVHEAPLSDTIPYKIPKGEAVASETFIDTTAGSLTASINHEESEHFRLRWNEIQGKFVDEPRFAVQQADVLVSDVINRITELFANEHGSLEGQWKQGSDVSTEDLRQVLQHYRSFFNRLVD